MDGTTRYVFSLISVNWIDWIEQCFMSLDQLQAQNSSNTLYTVKQGFLKVKLTGSHTNLYIRHFVNRMDG